MQIRSRLVAVMILRFSVLQKRCHHSGASFQFSIHMHPLFLFFFFFFFLFLPLLLCAPYLTSEGSTSDKTLQFMPARAEETRIDYEWACNVGRFDLWRRREKRSQKDGDKIRFIRIPVEIILEKYAWKDSERVTVM